MFFEVRLDGLGVLAVVEDGGVGGDGVEFLLDLAESLQLL
jgi:hypothetical protein